MENIRRRLMQQRDYSAVAELHPPTVASSSSVSKRRLRAASESPTAVKTRPTSFPQGISSEGWTFEGLLSSGPRFEAVRRVSALASEQTLLDAITCHERDGGPLIIEDWHKHPQWAHDLFNMDWLLRNNGNQEWRVRNVRTRMDVDMTLTEFVEFSRAKRKGMQSSTDDPLYGKDAECPDEWRDWVNHSGVLPSSLCPNGSNDLLKHLASTEKVESLMCYLGVQDTFTPCHKDLCASSGHNIMCYTEDGGSSFWFMTASPDAPKAGEYFQTHIGSEIDWEDHVTSIQEFADAPFVVYVAEQKLGDLVLVPPRSCHQVVNHGGLTLKTSWSRMTTKGLQAALYHELPIYRRVCRPEQYRVKYIVYRSLLHYTDELRAALKNTYGSLVRTLSSSECGPQIRSIASKLRDLVDLFDFVLHDEYTTHHSNLPTVLTPETPDDLAPSPPSKNDSPRRHPATNRNTRTPRCKSTPTQCNLSCDFCGADVFQGFFECDRCTPCRDDSDSEFSGYEEHTEQTLGYGLVLCPGCYTEGRTCKCGIMQAAQCRPFLSLLEARNEAEKSLKSIPVIGARKRRHQKVLTENDIGESDEIQMFHAGCTLRLAREEAGFKGRSTKTCSFRCLDPDQASHKVPYMHALYCGRCHRTACFRWTLNAYGLHSAAALLSWCGGQEEWHLRHAQAQKEFALGETSVQRAEKTGSITIYRDRLVIAAKKYSCCRPLYPESTTLGWYDQDSYDEQEHEADDTTALSNPLGPDLSKESNTEDIVEHIQDAQHFEFHSAQRQSALHGSTSTAAAEPGACDGPYNILGMSPEVNRPPSPVPQPMLTRRKQEVYVSVPTMTTLKRLRSSRTESNAAMPAKRRRLPESEQNDDTGDLSEEERRVAGNYASTLAAAMNSANENGPSTQSAAPPAEVSKGVSPSVASNDAVLAPSTSNSDHEQTSRPQNPRAGIRAPRNPVPPSSLDGGLDLPMSGDSITPTAPSDSLTDSQAPSAARKPSSSIASSSKTRIKSEQSATLAKGTSRRTSRTSSSVVKRSTRRPPGIPATTFDAQHLEVPADDIITAAPCDNLSPQSSTSSAKSTLSEYPSHAELVQIRQTVEQLATVVDEQKEAIYALKTDADAQKTEVSTQRTELAACKEVIESLHQKNKELEARLFSLQRDHATKLSDLSRWIEDARVKLTADIAELKGQDNSGTEGAEKILITVKREVQRALEELRPKLEEDTRGFMKNQVKDMPQIVLLGQLSTASVSNISMQDPAVQALNPPQPLLRTTSNFGGPPQYDQSRARHSYHVDDRVRRPPLYAPHSNEQGRPVQYTDRRPHQGYRPYPPRRSDNYVPRAPADETPPNQPFRESYNRREGYDRPYNDTRNFPNNSFRSNGTGGDRSHEMTGGQLRRSQSQGNLHRPPLSHERPRAMTPPRLVKRSPSRAFSEHPRRDSRGRTPTNTTAGPMYRPRSESRNRSRSPSRDGARSNYSEERQDSPDLGSTHSSDRTVTEVQTARAPSVDAGPARRSSVSQLHDARTPPRPSVRPEERRSQGRFSPRSR